ncbi:MAG TPA: D-glycerate dehydrogenase [Thermoleophilaceae bacterium]|nr:D-glycerate dehydrogenase [Thermoleophilaceae bacterium]
MATGQRVVVACALPALGVGLLRERFVVETGGWRPDLSWLRQHVPGAAAIVADPSVRVDAELVDRAGGSLKVVANFAVGYDNLDLDTIRERGIRAANTPDVLTGATAELAIALMLAAARRIAEADALVRDGGWPAEKSLLGRELAGATVGLVGFGRIARRVAELLRGFEVRLLFASRSEPRERHDAERRELGDLLASSDFVSVHVPLTAETRHLIDATRLAQMRRGAILVNTSRGAVVDTEALMHALRSGHLGAAGLDVYEDEPHVPPELRRLSNTVLLPHLGSATSATRDAMARLCVENVIAVLAGREPPSPLV